MKKFTSVFLFVLCTTVAVAQEGTAPKTVIKLNPLGAIFGNATMGFEFTTSAKNSINILPTFGSIKVNDVKYTSLGLGAEYRFYSKTDAPKGFYFAPGLRYLGGKVRDDNDELKFTTIVGKAVIGNQWIFKSGFVIDLNGGIGYRDFKYSGNTSGFSELTGAGITPELSFSLGYAF
jgi:hypothetical protein